MDRDVRNPPVEAEHFRLRRAGTEAGARSPVPSDAGVPAARNLPASSRSRCGTIVPEPCLAAASAAAAGGWLPID